ncbi:protein anachronism [Eupeodes corollae]|uniref:protein anachronism n=1 Tax=Eupeodes corollae TaxID=290404 RepID=UPI00248FCD9A|nr:protein anachronism [Eupeodes corollae]
MCRCLKLITALCFISAGCLNSVSGIRSRRTSIEDQTVESVRVDMKDERVLRLFNLTADELKKRTESLAATKAGSTIAPKDNQRFVNIKGYRFEDIRNRIQMAVNGHGTMSSENSDNIQHEMAAYPICNSNESSWQDDLNVTIRFSDSLFEAKSNALYLESAILRLYKLNPNNTAAEPTAPTKGCAEPNIDSQIRVTVSIVLRKNRREKKKRICNTLMMNVSQTGWVEIDIKRAIHIWETVERHRASSVLVGWLLIEVHDEEDRPRNAGLYFRPPKCDQADYAIPWNFYRSYSTLPTPFTDKVPTYPRIDIKLISADATLLPHNPEARPNSNLNREIYRISNHNSEESTTSLTPTDNLLVPSDSTEIHRHRQRHARHHHHHSHNSPAPNAEGSVAGATAATSGSTRSDMSSEEISSHTSDC